MSKKILDVKNLATERPSSLDPSGNRLFIYPAKVTGFFKKWRNLVYSVLIFIFLVLPWTTFKGEQTILLDLAKREFVFFGAKFYAHHGPLIFFPLFLTVLGLVYATSVFGRAWCGWACPQTVFIDFIYRRIEQWVEGNHIKRKKLDQAPWNLSKLIKKTIKWVLFFMVSAHIAHSFVAYFVGAKSLVWITLKSPTEHMALFITVQFLTLVFLLDFGWFREQFCIIMCPYGRFQSVLMGKDSLAILYDSKRGEPRGKPSKTSGDCIDCYKCVTVCPTGIDIRNGVQLECVACTACIDACDEVMTKIKKPKGLIRYSSVVEEQGGKRRIFNLRSNLYLGAITIVASAFIYFISSKKDLEFKIIRAIGAPYEQIAEGKNNFVLNHFKFHVINQSNSRKNLELKLKDPNLTLIVPKNPTSLPPGKEEHLHFFIKAPRDQFKASQPKIDLEILINKKSKIEVLQLLGPEHTSF